MSESENDAVSRSWSDLEADAPSELSFAWREREVLQRKARKPGSNGGRGSRPFRSLEDIPESVFSLESSAAVTGLARDKAVLAEQGIANPYLVTRSGLGDGVVEVDGRTLINFSNYDYLGLARDARVSAAATRAIDAFGTSVSASRLVAGQIPPHDALEAAIASFLGTEASMVFVSGYGTNVSVIDHLLGPDDLIVCDERSHNSVLTGGMRSGAKFVRFRHNDLASLERVLDRYRLACQRTLIVVEGAYSMDGTIPDLAALVDLKRRYRAMLMVDEAHSLGTLGASGRGLCEHAGVSPREVDLLMGTLSKACAGAGGYIAASATVVDYLKHTTPGFVFSVGLSPPDTAAAHAALDIIAAEPDRVSTLRRNADRLRAGLAAGGFDIGAGTGSPVVPLILGDSMATLRLSRSLRDAGISVHPIIAPGVPERQARLRFFVSSTHTNAQIDRTIETLDALGGHGP